MGAILNIYQLENGLQRLGVLIFMTGVDDFQKWVKEVQTVPLPHF
jgi:hypothetical protein